MSYAQSEPTAFIVTHVIKPGAVGRYEDWTREILRAVSCPGYLGREVVLPTHGDRRSSCVSITTSISGPGPNRKLVENLSGERTI